MAVKVIKSNYESICKVCHGWISVGDKIDWEPGVKGCAHHECPPVPAAPPKKEQVEVAPEVAALRLELSVKSAELLEAEVALPEVEVAARKAAMAAGWCAVCNGEGKHSCGNCHGRGYVQIMSDLYDNCGECHGSGAKSCHCAGKGLKASHPEVAPLLAPWRSLEVSHDSLKHEVASLESKIEKLLAPEVGSICLVVKGRKLPKGIKVKVVWMGEGNWGPQAKVLPENGGNAVYVNPANLEAVSHLKKVAAAA